MTPSSSDGKSDRGANTRVDDAELARRQNIKNAGEECNQQQVQVSPISEGRKEFASPLPIQNKSGCLDDDIRLHHAEQQKYNKSTWDMYHRITSARMKKANESQSVNLNCPPMDNVTMLVESPQQPDQDKKKKCSSHPRDELFDMEM